MRPSMMEERSSRRDSLPQLLAQTKPDVHTSAPRKKKEKKRKKLKKTARTKTKTPIKWSVTEAFANGRRAHCRGGHL